ncbi:MAG: esterase-like activity of phytase family protein [Deltaproteobacteria bacterium]|nr:esterase-like activity of phytase family protein [Deltaproteobacteria bacterium]
MKRVVFALLVLGCRGSNVDKERASEMFTRVPLATAPGLSGLASDEHGGLWTISERGNRAYRITLDAATRPSLETFHIEGHDLSDLDLEAIADLGGGKFAVGTEGRVPGVATVLLAERRAAALVITSDLVLSNADVGIEMAANHGAEGLCGAGDTIVVAIEGAGGAGPDARWAPIVRIENAKIVRTHKLALTTATGKISALDCTFAADGTITAWAIERHFEVTKVVTFTLPPLGQGDERITPTVLIDLGTVLNSQLNLEGIAHLADGRLVAVVDNQWKTLKGNSELLVFRPSALP